MAFLEIPSGLLVGLGFGIAGVSFWIVGIVVFRWLLDRYGPDAAPVEDRR